MLAPLFDVTGAPAALEPGAEGAVVVVGHSDCETSRLALRHADRLHRRRTRPMPVVAVLQDEPAEARAFVGELGLALPVLLDRDPYPLASRLALTGVPTTYVIDASGRVRETMEAFRRADFERLAALLGVPAPVFADGDEAPALRPG